MGDLVRDVVARLRLAGVVAAEEEAAILLQHLADSAGPDGAGIDALLARRCAGEPLAWIVGRVEFAGTSVIVTPGVYVPRPHTELLVARVVARVPDAARVVDLCTGSGAVARAIALRRPDVEVIGTDIDPAAVICAHMNEVRAVCGDLDAPLQEDLGSSVDAVVAVVPYVPTEALALLPSDTLRHESTRAYDGGPDGTLIVRRVIAAAARLLRDGGALVIELGGEQHELLGDVLAAHGFDDVQPIFDDDGDLRGLEATRRGPQPRS